MNTSLVSQILAENDYVQGLHVKDGVSPLESAYKRIKTLARKLRRHSPEKKNYNLALTILSNCRETELDHLRHSYYEAVMDHLSRAEYNASFERLQYRINLAISMLLTKPHR